MSEILEQHIDKDLKEIDWVKSQVKEELSSLQKESFLYKRMKFS